MTRGGTVPALVASAFSLALAGACGVGLGLPVGTQVACSRDADCPDPWRCSTAAGLCVEALGASAPRLEAAAALAEDEVRLTFDQTLMDLNVSRLSTYELTPALRVDDAYLDPDGQSIFLTTDLQTFGTSYTVTVQGLVSRGGIGIDPTANAQAFDGFGVNPDVTPPVPLGPDPELLQSGLHARLSWSPRVGARNYTVMLSTEPGCTPAFNTQQVAASVAALDVQLPSPGRYHWCVRADVTSPGEQGEAVVLAVDDAVLVYCPDGDTCAYDPSQLGIPEAPLRSINVAVALATELGIPGVAIASRGVDAYGELVQIEGTAVSLLGGFDPTFKVAARDPVARPTTLHYVGTVLRITNIQTTMQVDGLTLLADPSYDTEALVIRGSSEALTVSRCHVEALGAQGDANAVDLTASAGLGPTLDHCELVGGPAYTSRAISASGNFTVMHSTLRAAAGTYGSKAVSLLGSGPYGVGSVTFDDCDIQCGGSYVSYGIETNGGVAALNLRNSRLAVDTDGSISDGLYVTLDAGTLENNLIRAGLNQAGPVYDAIAMKLWGPSYLGSTGDVIIRNNVILTSQTGIRIAGTGACDRRATFHILSNTFVGQGGGEMLHIDGGLPIIADNLMVAWTPGGTCIAESSADGQAASVENNAFVGCATAYHDWPTPGGATDLTTAAEVNGLDHQACGASQAATWRFGGNIVSTRTPLDVFVDADGPDNVLGTDLDDDFRLLLTTDPDNLSGGGRDTTGIDCGTYESPQPCEGVASDRAGRARGPTWSVGAYQN